MVHSQYYPVENTKFLYHLIVFNALWIFIKLCTLQLYLHEYIHFILVTMFQLNLQNSLFSCCNFHLSCLKSGRNAKTVKMFDTYHKKISCSHNSVLHILCSVDLTVHKKCSKVSEFCESKYILSHFILPKC